MKDFWAFLARYKVRLAAMGTGVLIAVLCLLIGFWRTLLIVLLGGAGYLLGYYIEDPDSFMQFLWRVISFFKNRRHL